MTAGAARTAHALTRHKLVRTLSKFGVERLQNFDLAETFGPVVADLNDVTDVITLKTNPGGLGFHTIMLRNPYMGFLDFRAALTDETSGAWQVEPEEGNCGKNFDTEVVVRFKPEVGGLDEG